MTNDHLPFDILSRDGFKGLTPLVSLWSSWHSITCLLLIQPIVGYLFDCDFIVNVGNYANCGADWMTISFNAYRMAGNKVRLINWLMPVSRLRHPRSIPSHRISHYTILRKLHGWEPRDPHQHGNPVVVGAVYIYFLPFLFCYCCFSF